MKREFLEGLDLGEGVKLSKEAIDAIMAEHGKDIEGQKSTIPSLTTERDGLKTQLDAANTTIQSYKDLDIVRRGRQGGHRWPEVLLHRCPEGLYR